MSAEWAAEFDGFLSNDVTLESDILNIEEVLGHDREQMQALSPRDCQTMAFTNPTTQLKEFQEESSMCCVCWEQFLNEKQTRLTQEASYDGIHAALSPSRASLLSKQTGVYALHSKMLWPLRGSNSRATIWYCLRHYFFNLLLLTAFQISLQQKKKNSQAAF